MYLEGGGIQAAALLGKCPLCAHCGDQGVC
jgi:hypothetical protein